MSKPESTTRPNFGTTVEVKPGTGTRLMTVTNPDGSQTVERVPAEKSKPSK
jgi:hypothetical protein